MSVLGKISGQLNNERLDAIDLYAYVLTHTYDSRNFVAVGKVPASLGGSFQTLVSIVNPVNWLFAGSNGFSDDEERDAHAAVANGFKLTGLLPMPSPIPGCLVISV